MPKPSAELTALVGSRICHDLISPIGAIGNGLELLQMSGAQGPEIALIGESVENANARVRFFRVAFGAAPADQGISRREVCAILDDLGKGARVRVHWRAAEDASRADVQLVFLAILCCETALAHGGEVDVARQGPQWVIAGTGDELRLDPDLWARLGRPQPRPGVTPAQVQFALLPILAERTGRRPAYDSDHGRVTITF